MAKPSPIESLVPLLLLLFVVQTGVGIFYDKHDRLEGVVFDRMIIPTGVNQVSILYTVNKLKLSFHYTLLIYLACNYD